MLLARATLDSERLFNHLEENEKHVFCAAINPSLRQFQNL